jgi:VCBS repeat-containing protein
LAAGQGADPVEGESFTHPTGTEVVLGNQYSGGKALKITSGQALPIKREVTITEASHVLVRARAGQTGGSPTLTIRVDGNNAGTRRITSSVLSDYLYAGITLQPGTYTLGLKGGDLAQGRYVFVDVLKFPAVNDPPVANNDPDPGDPNYTTLEDAPLTVSAANGVLANDSDPGDTITAVKVSGPSHGTLALNPDGSFSYTPNADFNGTDSFTYQAKDSHGSLSTAATVTITVSPVNDKPTDISLSPSSVEENQPSGTTVGTLSSADVDAGDSHTYTLVTGDGDADNGSFTIDGNTLKTNSQFDFEAKDSYTIRVAADDGQGGTVEKQLTISITNANDRPTDITLSDASVDENQAGGTQVGTLATTDQDTGDSFTYELVSGPGDDDNASFQISGSSLKTAGPLNFEDGATRSVLVRTSDGHGGTFDEQFTITLGDLNDAPTNLALSSDTVAENQPSGTTVGTLSADDEEGDTPTFAFATGSGDADNGSFTIDGNTLKTNSQFDFEAKDSYTIRVAADDGQGGTVEKQFTITVTNANDAPTDISLSNSSVAENQPSGTTVGTLSSTDQDSSDTHTYTLVSGTGSDDNASFQISGDMLQTNEKFDSEIKDSYTVRVQSDDGHGSTFSKALTISITNANDAPTDIALSNSIVAENQPSGTDVGDFSATDQDSADTHTYTLVSGPGDDDNGSFQISGNTLKTNAEFDFEAKDSYTVRVQSDDGHTGGTTTKQFTITITNANDTPTDIALSDSTVVEHQPSGTDVGTLSTTDQDSADTHTYTLVSGTGSTDNGSFQISGGTLKTNAEFDFEAKNAYSIRVRTDDGNGGTVEEQFTVTVTNANDTPTDIALSNSSVAENQSSGTAVGTLSTTDQDTADTHTYTLVSGAGDADNGQFTITGDALKTGAQFDFETKNSYSVRVQSDDGHGGTLEEALTISVTNANDAPTDIALSKSTVVEHEPSGTAVGTLSTTDQDAADTHTYALVAGTGDTDNASFQVSGSELQTNADLAVGTYSVRVRTDDGNGGTFDKQFEITVVPANFAPTDISLSNSSVAENQPSGTDVGTLSTTDQDAADTHTYSLVAGSGDTDNASFTITGDTLQTSAQFDFETKNSYSIRVQTDDGHAGGTFSKQFTITITNANDAPTDIALTNSSVAENLPSGTTVGTLSSTDQDTADTHTYTLVTGAGDTDNASFTISGGTLKTNAQFNFEAKNSYSIRVQTSDGNGGTFEESFTITVTDANEAPTDIALSNSSVAENLPSGTDVGTFSTTDQDTADTHTYTLVTGTGSTDNASFTISGGTLKTNAQFNFEAKNSYSIRVQTSDGNGGTFEEQLTVTVTNANDAPTDIALSNSSVAENLPSGTTVGTLLSTDEDAADTHTYSLVSGTGDTDNASFQISGSTLQTNAQFDFEAKSSYSIRLQTSDGQGGTFQKQFTVTVTNANDAPTDIALSKANVDENLPSGTPVGTFSTTDQDAGDTHTYSLATGTGDTNNTSFQIVNGELRTSASFNFEAKNSYSIRVRTTDNGTPAQSFDEQFTITINDVNDAPVATSDSYSGAIGNTKASVGVTVTGEPVVALTGNVLTNNDTDEDATFPHTLSAVQETVTSTGGGTATISSDGSFTFLPGVGDKNQNDTFTYHVTDGQATATGTVTVGISNSLVWYVDNSKATNGDGRSTSPFNSLTGVNGAGGSGDSDGPADYIFLYQGSGNYTGGLPLEASQRLIGQAANLTVGSSTLVAGDPTKRPTITNAGADVIDLDDANEVRGLQVDPSGTGGGIAGATGDTGGATIDDVRIIDTGTTGTQPGLELDSTTGTFNISNLTVSTSGATGVRLNNAGTTNFASTGTISITTSGAKALDATGALATPTNMGTGSVFDDITVTGSGAGGVSMSGTTGTTTFGDGASPADPDLNLTTTSGTAPAFGLSNAGTVSVPSGGTANVSATGGPAIDVTGTSGATLGFDDVDSTNSSGDGVNIAGLGAGTFTANNSSTITDAATIDFDLDGGTGNVTYDGTITDDLGQLVRIANTSGGTKDFNGTISDGNDGDGNGVSLTNNTGATVRFDGGLTLSTGANPAFTATGGGTVAVTDPNAAGTAPDNTIATTTGIALNVANTTIGGSGLTFRSISANGAASGIVLNSTGSSGGLTVTGNGGTCSSVATCTGGAIQNTTGPTINLTSVGAGASLTRVAVSGSGDDGIRATTVGTTGGAGLALAYSFVSSNGNAVGERGLDYDNVIGASSITNSTIRVSSEDNARWENDNGTLLLTVTGSTFADNSAVSGADGLLLLGDATATMTANVTGNTFTHNRDDGFQVSTKTPSTAQMNVTFNGNDVVQGVNNVPNNAAVTVSPGSSSDLKFKMDDNDLSGSLGSALILNPGPDSTSAASYDAIVTNNRIGTSVADSGSANGIGIWGRTAGNGVNRFEIRNNVIQHFQQQGMYLRGNEGVGQVTDYTVTGNSVINPDGSGFRILLEAGAVGPSSPTPDSTDVCADFGGTGVLANTVASGGSPADIGVARDFAANTLTLRDYAGGNLATYFNSRNIGTPSSLTAILSNLAPAGSASACALPATPPLP